MKNDVNDLVEKYTGEKTPVSTESREYKIFKKYRRPTIVALYEKLCNKAGSLFTVKLSEKEREDCLDHLSLLDLKVTPEGIYAASLLMLVAVLLPSLLLLLVSPIISLVGLVSSVLFYNYIRTFPESRVRKRKKESSGEMVLAVLYVVTYMRHSSNLEEAIRFAADNLYGPLGVDMTKLLWDVEARKYADMNEALTAYLPNWKEMNPEFVDAMYLVRSVLYQTDEQYRLALLDEAVNRILDGTYNRMIRYASELRNPINTVYMMGIVLPVLGMVLFPMMSSFMSGGVPMEYLLVGYNIVLPIFVYLLVWRILKTRPAGFPHPDLSEHPDVPKRFHFFVRKRQIHAIIPAAVAFIVISLPFFLTLNSDIAEDMKIYVSMSITFALAISIYVFTHFSSKKRMEVLKKVYDIEDDFSHAVFEIGSLLSQDVPPEKVMIQVADSMRGSTISVFLDRVVSNIKNMGMSFSDAIFDRKYGAIWYYPSTIINSTMQILLETSKKSLKHAGISMIFVSKYLRNLNNINNKVYEVLDEVMSSMHFQVVFLSPIISGIVVGMTALITMVLGGLSGKLAEISSLAEGGGGAASLGFMVGIFQMTQATPLNIFQAMVGIYTIEVVVIIAYTIANIERVGDEAYTLSTISKMVIIPIVIYSVVAIMMTMTLGGIASLALNVGGMF